jgi:midasin (ATPase involved in ribosome maturation)
MMRLYLGLSLPLVERDSFAGCQRVVKLEQPVRMNRRLLSASSVQVKSASDVASHEHPPAKRSRLASSSSSHAGLTARWAAFSTAADAAARAVAVAEAGFAFHFMEGALVTALREGHWILLDEINLAPPQVETPNTPQNDLETAENAPAAIRSNTQAID